MLTISCREERKNKEEERGKRGTSVGVLLSPVQRVLVLTYFGTRLISCEGAESQSASYMALAVLLVKTHPARYAPASGCAWRAPREFCRLGSCSLRKMSRGGEAVPDCICSSSCGSLTAVGQMQRQRRNEIAAEAYYPPLFHDKHQWYRDSSNSHQTWLTSPIWRLTTARARGARLAELGRGGG